MAYEYLSWVLLLGVVWIGAFIFKKGLRRKMIISSLIAFPFGIGEAYFYPAYWAPETLFNLGALYGLTIEAFFLMFFLGGTAAFVYETVFKKKYPVKENLCGKVCKCNWSLITALVLFVLFVKLLSNFNIIYSTSFALLGGGIIATLIYPNLRKHIFFGGILYALFYWISLLIIELIFPGWIAQAWNFEALSGITFWKVPIEEILFGFAFGVVWAPLYEEICHKNDMSNKKYI